MNNPRSNKRRRQGQDHGNSGAVNGDDDDDDAYQKAYSTVRFHPIASTGRPGTPHRYFAESYAVEEITSTSATQQKSPPQSSLLDEGQEKNHNSQRKHQQVVHKHANGLVIVTAGDADSLLSRFLSTPAIGAAAASSSSSAESATSISSTSKEHNYNNEQLQQKMKTIQSIDFMVQEAAVAAQNASCKRKQQAKMLKGKQKVQEEEGVVRPQDLLAHVRVQTGSSTNSGANESLPSKEEGNDETHCNATHIIPLACCVWGTILERNAHLEKNPSLLQQDPLLDGYLAVILPTGPFPPPPPPPTR